MKTLLNKLFLNNGKGLIGLISDKTGKISFKRSASIVVLTAIAVPDVETNGLTLFNTIIICIALLAPTIPYLTSKARKE